MLQRILLSIFLLTFLFSITDCGFSNLLGKDNNNILVHDNFLLKIDNSKIAILGEQVEIDISLYNYSEENYQLGGLDIMVAYDPEVLQFDTVEAGEFIEYCNWWYYTTRHRIDTIGTKIVGTIRVTTISDHYFGDPICLTPTDSSTNQLSRLKFTVKNKSTSIGKTSPIQFLWKDCGDNMMADISANLLFASNNIYANGQIISAKIPYPNFTGYNNSCDSIYNNRITVLLRAIDFINGSVKITAK